MFVEESTPVLLRDALDLTEVNHVEGATRDYTWGSSPSDTTFVDVRKCKGGDALPNLSSVQGNTPPIKKSATSVVVTSITPPISLNLMSMMKTKSHTRHLPSFPSIALQFLLHGIR